MTANDSQSDDVTQGQWRFIMVYDGCWSWLKMVNDEQEPRDTKRDQWWLEWIGDSLANYSSINPEQVRKNLQLRWKFALLPFDCKRVPRVLVVPLMPNNGDFFRRKSWHWCCAAVGSFREFAQNLLESVRIHANIGSNLMWPHSTMSLPNSFEMSREPSMRRLQSPAIPSISKSWYGFHCDTQVAAHC